MIETLKTYTVDKEKIRENKNYSKTRKLEDSKSRKLENKKIVVTDRENNAKHILMPAASRGLPCPLCFEDCLN
jgi:hypothetical protein